MALPVLAELRILTLRQSGISNNPSLLHTAVQRCFRRCPKLDHVLIQDDPDYILEPSHFTRISVDGLALKEEEIVMKHSLGTVWWKLYDV